MRAQDVDSEFEALLEFLRASRAFDFTGYKRPSLQRRIDKRMRDVGIDSYGDYQDYLEVHPDEFRDLFDDILINVTGFFRDPQIWDYLIQEIVPQIVERKKPEDPIRAWSAGCASGQEAYSITMVLAEHLSLQAFARQVKVYGTDVDEDALAQARLATYPAKDLEPVPPPLRDKYFEESPTGYAFNRDLRRSVIFGRHDLVQDAPISRIDLLVCRNTLMYLNAETQAKVMDHLRFALKQGGFLVLGKAEMLFTKVPSLEVVDLKRRIFVKRQDGRARDRHVVEAAIRDGGVEAPAADPSVQAAFEALGVAQVVVNREGLVVLANEQARTLFRIPPVAIGRPFQELELSYRPADLRSRIEEVVRERRGMLLKDVQWMQAPGEVRSLDIAIVPVTADGSPVGIAISFHDVTDQTRLKGDLERSSQELETAMEELQSTNEELETTNEELQSTNEELETTNEELQSTNEELETMNEELQSTNEELNAVNDEMRLRSSELDQANAFLRSVLRSVGSAVIVLDREHRVNAWNERAVDLWGMREDEARGHSLFGLDIGLPAEEVRQLVNRSLAGVSDEREATVMALNRRGQSIVCRVRSSPLHRADGTADGAILLIDVVEGGTHGTA